MNRMRAFFKSNNITIDAKVRLLRCWIFPFSFLVYDLQPLRKSQLKNQGFREAMQENPEYSLEVVHMVDVVRKIKNLDVMHTNRSLQTRKPTILQGKILAQEYQEPVY